MLHCIDCPCNSCESGAITHPKNACLCDGCCERSFEIESYEEREYDQFEEMYRIQEEMLVG
jgi:hypothetical protein